MSMLEAAHLVFVAIPALALCLWFSWRHVSRLQILLRCAIIVYACGVVGVTLFPLPVQGKWIRDERAGAHFKLLPWRDYNIIPGRCITDVLRCARDASRRGYDLVGSLWFYGKALVGNLILLLPLGYLLPWLSKRWRRWWRTLAVVAAVTVSIELAQLLGSLAYGFPFKRFDVDDLWINTLGGLIGYGLWKLMEPLLRRFEKPLGAQAASSQEL